jgi:hypothetical protein
MITLKERTYTVSIKGTKNYQSVNLTEGFSAVVDEKFDEFNWAAMKEDLKGRLIEETKKCLANFTEQRQFDDNIEISIGEK